MRVAILGVGLIGGSIGLAAVTRSGATVSGFDPSDPVLGDAVARGAVGRPCASVAEAVDGADVVFCAAPVGALVELVRAALLAAPPECVVTDVGSTKRAIVAAVADPRFVGGHPIAGAETAGVAHARADLFDGATWYLTPRGDAAGGSRERLWGLLTAIGARPATIDADVHDRLLAAVSHLPHVLANVLAGQAAATLRRTGERSAAGALGPSLRDATRVAGAPSAIWTDIYLANRDALVPELDGAIARLTEARELLAGGEADAVTAWNDGAAVDRRALTGSDPEPGAPAGRP